MQTRRFAAGAYLGKGLIICTAVLRVCNLFRCTICFTFNNVQDCKFSGKLQAAVKQTDASDSVVLLGMALLLHVISTVANVRLWSYSWEAEVWLPVLYKSKLRHDEWNWELHKLMPLSPSGKSVRFFLRISEHILSGC